MISRPPAHRMRWVIFAVSSCALLVVSIDGTVVATALPTLSRELHASVAWTTWTVSAYSLGTVTGLPLAGRLSDALGRKRMFIVFAAAFTVTSMACGLVNNIYPLIALRFLQALWGCGLLPSSIGVISDQFGADRDRPIGLTTAVFPLGAMLGPAVGGLIVTFFSWRLIFFVNLPIGIAMVVMLWVLVPPDSRAGTRKLGIDVVGAALYALTVLSVMLGFTELGLHGWGSGPAWGVLALGIVFGAGFWIRQEHSASPVLALHLLKQRPFVVVNTLNLVYGAAAFGVFSLVPLYAQTRFGMRPLEAGALLTVRAGGMAAMSTITSLLVLRRFGYRRPMAAGFLVLVGGLILLSVSPPGIPVSPWLTFACLVCGLGVGLAGPPSNNAALQLMPSHVAEITALRSTFRQTGGIVAISVAAAFISVSAAGPRVLPYVFSTLAVLTLLVSPLIAGVPENRRSPAVEPAAPMAGI